MKLDEYSGYVGVLKQPLQSPERDRPSMYMIADSLKHELDLILLTPGTYLHAYKYIMEYRAKSVRLFMPSIGPEYISDVYNLCRDLKGKVPFKLVFPKKTNIYFVELSQIACTTYVNQFNRNISIRYVENITDKENSIYDVYDIVVSTSHSTNYFSLSLSQTDLESFLNSDEYEYLHIPYSLPLHGGLSYVDLKDISRRDKKRIYPYSFTSVEEYYDYNNRELPVGLGKFHDDPDDEKFPDDYEGDITDDEIMDMMFGSGGDDA